MVITQLFGGLGNQMFQYATGLSLAHHRHTYLKLSLRWFQRPEPRLAHERYALSCFNICENFATALEIAAFSDGPRLLLTKPKRLLQKWRARRGAINPPTFREGGHRFNPALFEQPADSHLVGYFQSEQYFSAIAPLVRAHFSFRFPPDASTRELLAQIADGPSAFVHFRRGDYVDNPQTQRLFGTVSLGYYERAVAFLRERVPGVRLFIFSDDPAYVHAHFRPDLPHVYVNRGSDAHAFDDLRLMVACQHSVLACSSFSWWGAWLNPQPDKVVTAPQPWFQGPEFDGTDVAPGYWTKFTRTGEMV